MILGRAPSKKNTHRRMYSRKLRRWIIAPSSKVLIWEQKAVLQLLHQKNKLKFDTITCKVHVEFKMYFSAFRRIDLTNVIQSCEDALSKAGIIEDDFFIYSLDGSRRILGAPVEEERAEIVIREYKEEVTK